MALIRTDCAVLFVHGILGNREFFDFLLPAVPPSWTVRRLLLKGHGAGVKDFGKADMASWKRQVSEAVEDLRQNHNHVVITAHSMGTLFAIQEAVSGRIDALFLLNTPLKIHLTRRLISTPLKLFFRLDNDVWTQAARRACSIELSANIFAYLSWIPRYIELFIEISRTRKIVSQLNSVGVVFLSAHDEMVSSASIKYFGLCNHVDVSVLENSGHFYYTPEESLIIYDSFRLLLSNISQA